jgi:hypothetical protein
MTRRARLLVIGTMLAVLLPMSQAGASNKQVFRNTSEMLTQLNDSAGYTCRVTSSKQRHRAGESLPSAVVKLSTDWAIFDECAGGPTVTAFITRDAAATARLIKAADKLLCKRSSSQQKQAESYSWIVGENWTASALAEPTYEGEGSAVDVAKALNGKLRAVHC